MRNSNPLEESQEIKKTRYAELLLSSYNQRPLQLSEMTLTEYLSYYKEMIGKVPKASPTKADQQRLIQKYQLLKGKLQRVIQDNKDEISQHSKETIERYTKVKTLIGNRQIAAVKALNSQFQSLGDDQDQELQRVKKVIQNGLWGYLDKIHQRIDKLHQLQNDLN